MSTDPHTVPAAAARTTRRRSGLTRGTARRHLARTTAAVAVAGAALGLAAPAHAYGYDVTQYADLDGNGTWDYLWDWHADGDVDAVYFDYEGDGAWNIGVADWTGDGVVDLVDTDGDAYFEYSDWDQDGIIDQLAQPGMSLVISSGCEAGHCVSPDMGGVGLALPHGWSTF